MCNEDSFKYCAPSLPSLANHRDFTGTSHPMLGVLFFLLKLLSHKGATHRKTNNLAPRLGLARKSFHSLTSRVTPLSQVKHGLIYIWQHNHAQKNQILFLSP